MSKTLREAWGRLGAQVLPRLRAVDSIPDTQGGSRTLALLTQAVTHFTRSAGVEKTLVVVDRLQKLEVQAPILRWSRDDTPQYGHLADVDADDARMTLLISLHEHSRSKVLDGYPVLGLSRVNKTTPGSRLTLADVPGKAELVFQANSVLLLEQAEGAQPNSQVTPTLLNVAKVRDGGWKGDIPLDFHHLISLFKERKHAAKGGAVPVDNGPAGEQPGRRANRFAGK